MYFFNQSLIEVWVCTYPNHRLAIPLAVSLAEPKPTAEIIILTLIINKMKKVLVANIVSTVKNDGVKSFEHELTELNRHLSEGWKIEKYDIVTSVVSYSFSIIYQLHKD